MPKTIRTKKFLQWTERYCRETRGKPLSVLLTQPLQVTETHLLFNKTP